MLGPSSTPAPAMGKITLAGGSRGRGGGLCDWRTRDRETGVVGGSRGAYRSGGLGPASLVPVEARKIKIIHASIRAGWEGVVLVQLVLAGQKAFESGHGHRAGEEGI